MAGGYSYKLSVRTQQQDWDCCVSVVCVSGGEGGYPVTNIADISVWFPYPILLGMRPYMCLAVT